MNHSLAWGYLHGDCSDGWHVCTKYHDHMHYYQATMLVIAMAMVVMGGMCVQSQITPS